MDIKSVKMLETKFKAEIITKDEYKNLLTVAFKGGTIGQAVYDEITKREWRMKANESKV